MAGSSSANAGMGWPLGLRSCMVAQDATSPRVAEEESSASITAVATAQSSWLQAARLVEEATAAEQHTLVGGSFNRFLPYLSDASVSAAESLEFDSDFQSETGEQQQQAYIIIIWWTPITTEEDAREGGGASS
ncbi:unnamed protein product [Sphagnum troendelagicum]